MHRFQHQHQGHPDWKKWWDSLRGDPAVEFYARSAITSWKEASPKVGQIVFGASIGVGVPDTPAYKPNKASEFY
jgi:hypothetical protein